MKYDVFISYSRRDTDVVMSIVEPLKKKGVNVWMDVDGIYTGDSFKRTIVAAIKESELFLFFSSEASNLSEWTTKEVGVAVALKKKIIPVKLDDCVYSDEILLDLVNLDFIQASVLGSDKVVEKLFSSIQKEIPTQKESSVSNNSVIESQPLKTSPKSKTHFTVNGVSFDMVEIEGGTFLMGSDDADAYDDEKPVHSETVSTFRIGKTEVTQALWKAVMGRNPSRFRGDNLPVECVSWNDCKTFIDNLNILTGENFRLPTEAEWEYAACGGNKSRGYKYSGSNNLDEVAWCESNSGLKTHPVGTRTSNELGLYDMSGNVWDWTSDLWCDNYSSSRSGSHRVRRGGSWRYDARGCRVSSRSSLTQSDASSGLGFRLAL